MALVHVTFLGVLSISNQHGLFNLVLKPHDVKKKEENITITFISEISKLNAFRKEKRYSDGEMLAITQTTDKRQYIF